MVHPDLTPADVFNFARRLMFHLYPDIGQARAADDPAPAALREIATGQTCLASPPPELAGPPAAPDHDELLAHLQRNVGKLIEKDKRIATAILATM